MTFSITRRLVALFTLTTLIVIGLMSAALYHVLTVQLTRYQLRQVASALHDRAYQIERVDRVDRWERVDAKMAVLTPPDGGMRYWVLSGDPVFATAPAWMRQRRSAPRHGGMGLVAVPGQEYPFNVLARNFPANGQRPAVTLVVGIDTRPFAEARRVFLLALGVLSAAGAVAVYMLGHVVVRIGLRPLLQLSGQAGRLNAANLSQRLAVVPPAPELTGMTEAFNGALDRLEQAYRQSEAFNADVAHELRTPLGNLIGLTQVALARPRNAGELEEMMQSNLEELERLRSIVNDMLFLARADRGESPALLADTCIAGEIGKTIEFLELALEEAGKTVVIEGDLAARARLDAPLFRRAIVNLLHNAILYSSAHRAAGCQDRHGRPCRRHRGDQSGRHDRCRPSATPVRPLLPRRPGARRLRRAPGPRPGTVDRAGDRAHACRHRVRPFGARHHDHRDNSVSLKKVPANRIFLHGRVITRALRFIRPASFPVAKAWHSRGFAAPRALNNGDIR
jgi:two-component system heavy metal sensor histidine kinase CusS